MPKPAITRPSGSAPSSRSVRPAWFSKPASVSAGPRAVEQDVADHAPLARDRVQRQQADAGQLGARAVAVEAAEELVAAAHREERGARLDRLVQRRALRDEVGRDERLLAVLAAADVEEVGLAARASPRPIGVTSSSWPRAAARAESTAMFPRSA